MNRYLIIPDTHGKHAEVKQLLELAQYDPAQDILIFLGDYNDHFPSLDWNTKNLIDYLITLKQNSDNVYFIRGNHDLWMAEWVCIGGIPV